MQIRHMSRKLDDIAKEASVSPRTVRYYIQRGLLRAPEFRGADTSYDDDHVLHLRVIRQLQEAFWPLDAIQTFLAMSDKRSLEKVADGRAVPAPPSVQVPVMAAPAEPESPRRNEVRVRRIELAEGLFLEVDERHRAQLDTLIERIEALVAKHPPTKITKPRSSR